MSQKNLLMKEFLKLLLSSKDLCFLEKLFDLFFTLEEKNQIPARYAIIKALLTTNLSQREISKKSKVSISQITRGSNALKTIDPTFKKFLIHYLKEH